MNRTICFYLTAGGASPVEKFLNKLPTADRDKVLAAVLEVAGSRTPPSTLFCKMMNTDALWEIRTKHRGNIYRLLCFFDGRQLVVAAHGFRKKTQKTPRQEIKTAETRKKDYFRRKENEK